MFSIGRTCWILSSHKGSHFPKAEPGLPVQQRHRNVATFQSKTELENRDFLDKNMTEHGTICRLFTGTHTTATVIGVASQRCSSRSGQAKPLQSWRSQNPAKTLPTVHIWIVGSPVAYQTQVSYHLERLWPPIHVPISWYSTFNACWSRQTVSSSSSSSQSLSATSSSSSSP